MSNLGPIGPNKRAAVNRVAMQLTMQVFHYAEDETDFRVLDKSGDPWFVLSDVARKIGVKNPSDLASRLDDDEKGVAEIETPGGRQPVRIINESGLYSAILGSSKPQAKRFKKWVTSEVLPTIRKTGSYGRRVPIFIRRFNENWDRVPSSHFSVINELVYRLWGRLEMVGHTMADFAPNGKQNRPDVSVGRRFAAWLEEHHPTVSAEFQYYEHKTDEWEGDARMYPRSMLPLFLEYVDDVWIPLHAPEYFNSRDPAALPFLPLLLPKPDAA